MRYNRLLYTYELPIPLTTFPVCPSIFIYHKYYRLGRIIPGNHHFPAYSGTTLVILLFCRYGSHRIIPARDLLSEYTVSECANNWRTGRDPAGLLGGCIWRGTSLAAIGDAFLQRVLDWLLPSDWL